jgi:arylsulfatase
MLGGGLVAAGAGCLPERRGRAEPGGPPNFVVIFCDDLGYSDLSCFGSTTIRTPRLDRMAAEGMKFTDFYAAAPVCTPSRAALLTARYPKRVGLTRVVFPKDKDGLKPEHKTIAEVLKTRGYATACIGKWHVGCLPQHLPMRHGFDYFFGIPYSNDMKPTPLMRNDATVEEPANQDTLMERYTDECIKFIKANRDRPFFLYMAHNMPHIPLHITARFKGKSQAGLYGDVVQAIDWSTGQILDALEKLGLDGDTLVVFTSDNGPWLVKGKQGGSALPLRDGKGTTWDGGMREPCIMRWPGRIPAGKVCSQMALTMDFLPTFAALAGATLPDGYRIDGKDIGPLLAGQQGAVTPHEAFFYYNEARLEAVRSGPWKLILYALPAAAAEGETPRPRTPELYNLVEDIGEKKNVASAHPDIVERLTALAEAGVKDIGGTLGRKPPSPPKPAAPAAAAPTAKTQPPP